MSPLIKLKSSKSRLFYLQVSKIGQNLLPLILLTIFLSVKGISQTLPLATSCTSKDLELKSVKLAYTGPCFPFGQPTNVVLEIANKTGSLRTSFACWAKLIRTTKEGTVLAPVSIFICGGPIQPSITSSIITSTQITVNEGESLLLKDLFLAWTSSNSNQTCDYLKNNSSNINPKCGTLPSILVQAGVAGTMKQSASVCGESGSLTNVTVSPYGGTAPYKISIDGGADIDVVASDSYTFLNLDASVSHAIKIKDKNGCINNMGTAISNTLPVVANAGSDFTKNCLVNIAGASIGENAETGFSYTWSPSGGLSNTTDSKPFANPTETTTYTVTKTNTSTGCKGTDQVVVSVNNSTVSANAGSAFVKTCVENLDGKEIGESSAVGFTYSWTPSNGLSNASLSNPNANPSITTSYTLTKTNTSSGCFGTSQVEVTVNDTKPTFGVTIVQPTASLCAASTLGSVNFCATGGSNFEYSINDGNSFQSSSSFSNLSSGSVTGYKVKNSFGCLTTATCENVQNCQLVSAVSPMKTVSEGNLFIEKKSNEKVAVSPVIKAYPNPFNGLVTFNVVSTSTVKSVLEIFDVTGKKLGVIFQGILNKGENKSIQYNVPTGFHGTLIYKLTSEENVLTGSVISVSQKYQK